MVVQIHNPSTGEAEARDQNQTGFKKKKEPTVSQEREKKVTDKMPLN
jgi:hypothetical protein